MTPYCGSLVAIVTPMQPDGALDLAAWSQLIEWHVQSGSSGIVVGGTTGESATLSDAELRELTERACREARGRIQVIAGAGTSSTATTVERTRWLSELPVDGLLIVTPAYNRPTQEGLYRHFAAAAQASRVPLIAYNVPARTAVDMLPATVVRLAQLPRMAGIKEAVPQIERIRELMAGCPDRFSILSGDDATASESVLAGAHGVISVTANVVPQAMAELMSVSRRDDRASAQRLDGTLAALHAALFAEPNPIPVKWALKRLGRIGGGIRLPLTPLSESYWPAVESALTEAGALRT